MADSPQTIGPPRIPFTTFLLKVLAGGVGGSIGALILLLLFIVIYTVFPSAPDLQTVTQINPIFVFLLMLMVFLALTPANLLSVFLLSLTEREKYVRVKSALYQIFIVNLIIFLLMVPVYFMTATINMDLTPYVVALHIILATQISAIILEVVSDYRHSLVGIYGITFSILVSVATMFLLQAIVESSAILLFLMIPVVWGSIAVVQSITTIIYGWIASIYDKDFLSTQEVYGDDYGKEVDIKETPKAKDEEGGDFLRHN